MPTFLSICANIFCCCAALILNSSTSNLWNEPKKKKTSWSLWYLWAKDLSNHFTTFKIRLFVLYFPKKNAYLYLLIYFVPLEYANIHNFVPPEYSAKQLLISSTIVRFSLLHSNLKFSPLNLCSLCRIIANSSELAWITQNGLIWIKNIYVSFGIVAVGTIYSHFIWNMYIRLNNEGASCVFVFQTTSQNDHKFCSACW